ncbi:MAG: DUF4835 family protein [Ignavibacteriales bacterium]|nr:DUF4835 family protein [Ignavibacteriales bacterium]
MKKSDHLFDPNYFKGLTSFLDYYAYMVIGFENDSWEKGAGTPFFQKAFDLVNLAMEEEPRVGKQDRVITNPILSKIFLTINMVHSEMQPRNITVELISMQKIKQKDRS